MAEAQRPDAPRRRRLWPLWAAVLALLVAGAVVFMLRPRAPAGGPPFASPQQPGSAYTSRLRTLEDVTAAPDPSRLANYRVELPNLPVVETAGRAFWVADREGRRILVVPNNPQTPAEAVAAGRAVSITGAVRAPGPAETIENRMGVPRDVAELAARQLVFIRADSIRPGAEAAHPAGTRD